MSQQNVANTRPVGRVPRRSGDQGRRASADRGQLAAGLWAHLRRSRQTATASTTPSIGALSNLSAAIFGVLALRGSDRHLADTTRSVLWPAPPADSVRATRRPGPRR